MSQIITNSNKLIEPENWPNVLITVDNWFAGPDGNQYKYVYGKMDILTAKALLGFDPKQSTNWFVAVGPPGEQMIIMGCQIHYVAMCPTRPKNLGTNILDMSEE